MKKLISSFNDLISFRNVETQFKYVLLYNEEQNEWEKVIK